MTPLSCPKAGKSSCLPYPISVAGLAPLIGVVPMSEYSGGDLSSFSRSGEIAQQCLGSNRPLGSNLELRAISLAWGDFTEALPALSCWPLAPDI